MSSNTNWELIHEALAVIQWLRVSNNPENKDKKLYELFKDEVFLKYGDIRLFGKSLLLMAAYMLFVYPKEKDFNLIQFDKIDFNKFNILHQDYEHSNKELSNRIRNALVHSNYMFRDNTLIFSDNNHRKNSYIEMEISVVDFGEFITDFIFSVDNQFNQIYQ